MAKKRPTKKKKPSEQSVRKPSSRQIAKLDREILSLINARAELTAKRDNLDGDSRVSDDKEAFEHIVSQNKGPLDEVAVRAIFREVLSGSHAVGHPTSAAYLGPEFTYSHLAAIQRFGQSVDLVPVGTIASVFEEVERGHAEFGIVPIENSTDGRVADALDCLARSSVKICGEIPLAIHHCLLGLGVRGDIEQIYSKAQPLSQCRNWLSKHMPDVRLREVASTGEAARKASQEANAAAIASEQSAANHGLKVLARKIEDNPDNVTRFAVIGTQGGARTGKDKTSLVFEIGHKPGALADAMGIFKRHRLNMTWIESFPVSGQRGTYLFFIEFQGHASELRARRAMAALEKKASRLTVLGSYAQAEPIG